MSQNERTNWRDEEISKRHRLWGYDCPAQDIDFLLIEYDRCEAVALIEYKNEHAEKQTPDKPQYQVLMNLCKENKANIPVFSVRYADGFTRFTITALNELAKKAIPNGHDKPPRIVCTEKEYVAFLYKLRERKAPESILEKLNG